MAWNDGIPRTRSFSLTDIHDYEQCVFRFLVRHHLEKKQEIDDSSPKMALGTLLDESIKLFHLSTEKPADPEYVGYVVKGALNHIKRSVAEKGEKSFYFKHLEYLTAPVVEQAIQIFKNYYRLLEGKIYRSLGPVGFCEYIFDEADGRVKLWGGPDTYELGEDGVAEVVDYKYHEDPERGVERLDMDLMPKIYMLLSSQALKQKGYKQARFRVRQWNNPLDLSLSQDFDLDQVEVVLTHLRSQIRPILDNKTVVFCEKPWCRACNSPKREEYLAELRAKQMVIDDQGKSIV